MKKGFKYALVFILCSYQIVCFCQKEINYKSIETSSKVIYDICFTKSGQAIGIADDNSIKVYLIETNELIREFEGGHNKQIRSIDISKDSTFLVSGGKDSTVVIWDFLGGKKLKSIKSNGIITSVCISPNGEYLVYGGTENKVFVYGITNEKPIGEFSEHSDDITSIVFSPDGQYFASSSGDKTINIYKNKTLVTKLLGHKDWVRCISFNSENTKLISCSDDGKTIMWNISDINNPRIIEKYNNGHGWLLSVDFNQDNQTYALADYNGNVKIIGNYGNYTTYVKSPVNTILFKPNEGVYLKIAIATRGKGVLLIDAKNMKSKHKK